MFIQKYLPIPNQFTNCFYVYCTKWIFYFFILLYFFDIFIIILLAPKKHVITMKNMEMKSRMIFTMFLKYVIFKLFFIISLNYIYSFLLYFKLFVNYIKFNFFFSRFVTCIEFSLFFSLFRMSFSAFFPADLAFFQNYRWQHWSRVDLIEWILFGNSSNCMCLYLHSFW